MTGPHAAGLATIGLWIVVAHVRAAHSAGDEHADACLSVAVGWLALVLVGAALIAYYRT